MAREAHGGHTARPAGARAHALSRSLARSLPVAQGCFTCEMCDRLKSTSALKTHDHRRPIPRTPSSTLSPPIERMCWPRSPAARDNARLLPARALLPAHSAGSVVPPAPVPVTFPVPVPYRFPVPYHRYHHRYRYRSRWSRCRYRSRSRSRSRSARSVHGSALVILLLPARALRSTAGRLSRIGSARSLRV